MGQQVVADVIQREGHFVAVCRLLIIGKDGAGVVEQDIQSVVYGAKLSGDAAHLVHRREIGDKHVYRIIATLRLQLHHDLAGLGLIAPNDDDLSAHFQQFKRCLFADAVGRAGDQYAFALHSHSSLMHIDLIMHINRPKDARIRARTPHRAAPANLFLLTCCL